MPRRNRRPRRRIPAQVIDPVPDEVELDDIARQLVASGVCSRRILGPSPRRRHHPTP